MSRPDGAQLDLRHLGQFGFVARLFFGLKAAVLAVVIEAVLRVGRRALKSRLARDRGGGFVACSFFAIRFRSSSWRRRHRLRCATAFG